MKKTTILLLTLFSLFRVFSQDTIVRYLDSMYHFTQKDSARYIREVIIKNNCYFMTDKYINGVIYNYCEYSSLNPRIEEGSAIHYNENGEIYSKGNYKSGKIDGKWIYFTSTSVDTVEYLSPLSSEKKEYPTAKYYMDDPETVTVGNLVMDSLSAFIKYKYHHPARARSDFKKFTLRLNCIIDTEGKVVSSVIPVSSIHPDISGEIYRILGLFQYDAGSKKPFSISLEMPYDENGFHENNIHNAIFNVVQQMPKFKYKGTIRQYIEAELKAASFKCAGQVRVSFVVEKDGSISQVELMDSVGDSEECFKKIETILTSSPKWIPGKMRNNPVRVRLMTSI